MRRYENIAANCGYVVCRRQYTPILSHTLQPTVPQVVTGKKMGQDWGWIAKKARAGNFRRLPVRQVISALQANSSTSRNWQKDGARLGMDCEKGKCWKFQAATCKASNIYPASQPNTRWDEYGISCKASNIHPASQQFHRS